MAQSKRPSDLPEEHTATRAPDNNEQMLIHSTENSDEWIQGNWVDPTSFR